MTHVFLCVCRFRVPANMGLHLESSGHHISQLHSSLRPQVPAQEVLPARLLQTHPMSCLLHHHFTQSFLRSALQVLPACLLQTHPMSHLLLCHHLTQSSVHPQLPAQEVFPTHLLLHYYFTRLSIYVCYQSPCCEGETRTFFTSHVPDKIHQSCWLPFG